MQHTPLLLPCRSSGLELLFGGQKVHDVDVPCSGEQPVRRVKPTASGLKAAGGLQD